ncbi:hypothetical protein Tco_1223685 [Tanacetum coccineum]
MKGIRKDEYAIEIKVFNLLEIDADLFTYETPLGMVVNEFKGLDTDVHGLDVDMEYDPSNVNFVEWLASKFSNDKTMDWYTKNALWIYWMRGDDEEVLTDEELSDLEEENLSEGDEIVEILRIETDIFDFETSLCKSFKEFNYLLKIDVDVLTKYIPIFKTYEEYKDEWIYQWNNGIPWVAKKPWSENGEPTDNIDHGIKDKEESSGDTWSHYSPINKWENFERINRIETNVNSNYNCYLDVCQIFNDHARITNDDDVVQADQGWFDNHEPIESNDDDIGDLGDYLIWNEGLYYVDEEEERSKEIRFQYGVSLNMDMAYRLPV